MYFNFSILNFFRKKNNWDKYFSFTKRVSKHKFLEIEGGKDGYHFLSFEFKIGFKEDHAGIRMSFTVFCRELTISFYDCRHWDYINNCWEA